MPISLSVMETLAVVVPNVTFTGLESVREKLSDASTSLSSKMATEIVLVCSPAAKLKLLEALV